MRVDGDRNTVQEIDTEAVGDPARNPYGNAFTTVARTFDREPEARSLVDPLRGRFWTITNPGARNANGQPVAYKLVPGANVLPFALPDSDLLKRAAFAGSHLWVTHYDPRERFPAGDYPNQHPGGAGLPAYQRSDRPIVDDDVVVWYSFGSHHIVRPEEWPVMPVARLGFRLEPAGFFDRNPALDVAPGHHGTG